LLTSQTILFAAYGVTFANEKVGDEADVFRVAVALSGIAVAVLVFVGVLSAIQAKHQSWKDYCDYYAKRDPPDLPGPLRATLDWGVRTKITKQALILDRMLPFVFIVAWVAVLSL
jgi:hypothetical protein